MSTTEHICPTCHKGFFGNETHCPEHQERLVTVVSEAAETLAPDTMINGKYRVVGLIGRGGMGQVYRAVQLSMQRDVAIKLLNRSLSGDADIVRRFLRESRANSKLSHPNIITVFDFGQREQTAELFMVMELLQGRTLTEFLKERGRIQPQLAVAICGQVCDALTEAHRHGVVHRDLKPDNIFVRLGAGHLGVFVKVLDFGIAKITTQEETITKAGDVCGTPAYMSPEQAAGKTVGPHSDIYSLGVVLYRMLTGTPPFRGETPMQRLMAHVLESPTPIPSGMGVSPPLVTAVMRALAKEPERRPATADAFKAEVYAAIGLVAPTVEVGQASPSLPVMHAPTDIGSRPGVGFRSTPPPQPSSNVGLIVAIALAVVLAAGAVVGGLYATGVLGGGDDSSKSGEVAQATGEDPGDDGQGDDGGEDTGEDTGTGDEGSETSGTTGDGTAATGTDGDEDSTTGDGATTGDDGDTTEAVETTAGNPHESVSGPHALSLAALPDFPGKANVITALEPLDPTKDLAQWWGLTAEKVRAAVPAFEGPHLTDSQPWLSELYLYAEGTAVHLGFYEGQLFRVDIELSPSAPVRVSVQAKYEREPDFADIDHDRVDVAQWKVEALVVQVRADGGQRAGLRLANATMFELYQNRWASVANAELGVAEARQHLWSHPARPSLALQLASRADEAVAEYGEAIVVACEAAYFLGQVPRARGLCEIALAGTRKDVVRGEAHFYLAAVDAQAGKLDSAKQHLAKAKELLPPGHRLATYIDQRVRGLSANPDASVLRAVVDELVCFEVRQAQQRLALLPAEYGFLSAEDIGRKSIGVVEVTPLIEQAKGRCRPPEHAPSP